MDHNMKKADAYSILGKQVGYVIATNIITILIGIIQMPILTKALGASLYGIWSLISLTIALITPFAVLSFSLSIVRFLAAEKDNDKIREDFFSSCTLVFISGTFLSLLLFVFADFLAASIFKDSNSAIFIRLSSILVLLNSIFSVLLAFFRRGSKIGMYNFLGLGLIVLQMGLIVLFLSLGYGLAGVILSSIISTISLIAIASLIILKQISFRRPRFTNMKKYLKWGIPLTPNSAIDWIIRSSDRYIVDYFLGITATGIYSAAYNIGTYASFALMPVSIVLYPMVSKAYDEKNLVECRNLFKYSIKYLMMISIPAATGLSTLSMSLLRILTAPEFMPGSPIVALVAFGAVFSCFSQIGSYVIHLVGKTHMTVRFLATAAVTNIGLNILLVPRIGIFGSGLASLFAYVILSFLILNFTRNYIKYDLNLIFILKCLASSGVMALIIWFINPESLPKVIVSIIIGILVYFMVLILIRGLSKSELLFFVSFAKNITREIFSPRTSSSQ
jgi:O-antigen/teichoic acid export membrane protein